MKGKAEKRQSRSPRHRIAGKRGTIVSSEGCDSREYTYIREECLVWKDRILGDEEQLKLR
jgi:hypothetical protein